MHQVLCFAVLMNKTKGCMERYIVLSCGDINEMYKIPMEHFEKNKAGMNYSVDKLGNPKYWHIVLFRDQEGVMTRQLSKPEIKEIIIDDYKI